MRACKALFATATSVFSPSPSSPEMVQIPRSLWERLTNALAYAA